MRTLVALLVVSKAVAAAAPSPVGLLNAVKGDAQVNGAAVTGDRTTLPVGGVLRTADGMVELLLAPGTFLRLDQNSELTLQPAGAKLTRGEALLEVLYVETPVVIDQHGVHAVVREPGLYDFDDRHSRVAVYDGQASVNKGSSEMVVDAGSGVHLPKLRKFRASPEPGSMLVSWSSFRSELLSSQSAAVAQTLPPSAGPAWYRDASGSCTFLSPSGYIMSPFGWPFYAPGRTHNQLPMIRGGEYFLYGPPVVSLPSPEPPRGYPLIPPPPTVPLTAPGVPQFKRNQ